MTERAFHTLGRGALVAVLLSMLSAGAFGGDQPERPEDRWRDRPIRPYRHGYQDGLYSTIVTMISIGAPKIDKQKSMNLKVKGWKKDLKIRAIIQKRKAPLVVVLVGADGKADTPLGRLFPYWLDLTGMHVLSFDSPFRPSFTYNSRHGVSGNMMEDGRQIANVIAAFLKEKEIEDKVMQVGVVGYSLGGLHAMVLAHLAAKKELPFELSGALAFSPPIRLKSTAQILDGFYNTDRWKYTMVNMGKTFLSHEPVKPGAPIPFKPSFMRAGIGYLVREEFTQIVEKNDSIYRLRLIPDEEDNPGVNRLSEARAWGFQRFLEKMSFPYWQKNGKLKNVEELWEAGDLTKIMQNLPTYAHAIFCENDPFISPADLEALKKSVNPRHLTIKKIGGHMGYVGSGWDYDHLIKMFHRR